uniref:Kinetochore protein Nuf2 N-terminal domain-containing protein n=4 Tax=Corethron hystrix TaxID=216773 RepID=A0A7S1FYI8_9STRA|mmetsp:Transcript_39202/g.91364  ORF Transcript_39202/g.91364 Transcript_39202/m.91364 type:complete len:382 (+) Transcript_39202:270-1415(+)
MYYSQHNAAAQQHPTYHAPLLKTAVIIQCMHEMEIPMSEHELLAPERHKEPTKQVFVRLVEYCLGINKEELSQPQFSGLQDLAYPELYEDAFFEASLLRESTRLMTICGEPDFGLHDFVTPSSKRLQKHLSAVINLAKYRLESLESYLELNEKREGVLNELNELKIEQDQLRNKLEDAKEVAMQDNGAVQDVYSEISEVEADIAKLNEQNTLIRRQNNELKKKHNFLKDSVDTTSVSIQELKNEEKKLLPQIVQSPQRLKREMSTLESALESERKESSTVEKQVQLVKVAAANVADATKATSTVNEKLEEIKSELDKENMLLPEINITRGNLSKNLNKMTELSNNIDHAKRQHHKYGKIITLYIPESISFIIYKMSLNIHL